MGYQKELQALLTDEAAQLDAEPSDVRHFYDQIGWKTKHGRALDTHLFGFKEDGPVRQYLDGVHRQRLASAIGLAGDSVKLLECGCGGNPVVDLLGPRSEYVGADFSETGLQLATEALKDADIPWKLRNADIRRLPFDDHAFDAVFCAHVLYHIAVRNDQQAALTEMLRVLRPGGVLVLVTANPYPLIFPIRLLTRLLAALPGVARLAATLGRRGVLPYNPPSLGWLKRHFAGRASVEVRSLGVPSTYFHQNVTEFSGAGKYLWRAMRHLDVNFPRASAYLGNYVLLTVVKRADDA